MEKKNANKFNPNRDNIKRFFANGDEVDNRVAIRTKGGKVILVSQREAAHINGKKVVLQ